jgi:tryptophan halogenase
MADAGVRDIVVVGGGSAGWMTAAALSRFLERGWRVRLVESDEIGTVGVGEATIPQIRLFLAGLGLSEADFLRATGGSYKLGIQFVDWFRRGETYLHSFQQPGASLGLLTFHPYWLRGRALGLAGPLDAYSLPALAAAHGRFTREPPEESRRLGGLAYAFHIDATLLARALRSYAEARGVVRTEGRVARVNLRGGDGFIESVTLASGETVAGELFIDCSGFRGLLIGEGGLEVPYEDWSRWLPCDRALAVPSARTEPLTPYTRSTSSSAGWRWRIPLQHRTGNGYVYCSRFIDDVAARAELLAGLDGEPQAEPRPLRFVTGKRARFWEKNCVALGLASGFMEPLESTSLHLVQSGIARVLSFLPGREIAPADVAAYNRLTHYEFDRIRDFLVLHYKATRRDDTPFWRFCQDLPVPDSLAEKLEVFRACGRVVREQDELFTEASWLQVMLGQGIAPAAHHPLADIPTEAELADFLAGVEAMARRAAAAMPDHGAFVRDFAPAAFA